MKLGPAVLILLACAFVSAPAHGDEWSQRGPFTALSGAEAAAFALPSDMVLVRRIAGEASTYERYAQRYAGAAVFGAEITLRRDAAGTITAVLGRHYSALVPRNAPGLSRRDAEAIAERDLGASGSRRAVLMIDPIRGRFFHRVETRRLGERWVHWIDADTGDVLRKYDALVTDHGTGVKGDTKSVIGAEGTQDDLTAFHNKGGHGERKAHWDLVSKDGRRSTYDARNGTASLYLATDLDNHWTTVTADRRSPGQPALVDAQYYAAVADRYFAERHGFDWIADCGYAAMQSIAHYGSSYNNAFWDGTYVAYGDGDGMLLRELSGGLDVVAHELTHAITECTAGLVYQDESGALNEAFSDMLAAGAEFHAEPLGLDPSVTPDFWIGEDVYLLADDEPGFRNLADPAEDAQPDHYSERQVGGDDNGGVHFNSGIPNHAFYLLANGGRNAGEARGHPHSGPLVLGIGREDAEHTFFPAFTGLPADATMCNARAATEAIAASLFGAASQQQLSTTDAWLAVGVTDAACRPPDPPTDLVATGVSTSRIDLAWTDNAVDETGYKVERSADATTFTQVAILSADAASYSDTGLAADMTYSYRVRASQGAMNSAYSNVASATTRMLAAPSGLVASAGSTSRIDLAWTDNTPNEGGYKVERSAGGGSFTQVATLAADAASYSDFGLSAATTYSYRVRAYEGPNHSAYSNTASGTTQPAPAAPSGLTAVAAASSRINLTWTDGATNEAGFKIERSTNGNSFTQVGAVVANTTSFSDVGLSASTKYYYRVRAYEGSNNSAYSNTASAKTQATPSAPTGLTAAAASTSRIDLAWTDNATNETGFKIERSIAGASFVQISAVAANVRAYSDFGLSAGTSYAYRVRAYDGPNNSAYSNTATATTALPPAAPTNLAATAASTSRVDLAWTDNATNEAGFKVERSMDGAAFVQVATTIASATSYSDTGLAAGATFYYRVRAYEGSTNSAYSNTATVTTQPAPNAPAGLTATAASPSRIDLAWTDSATNEAGFKVERSLDGQSFTQVATTAANATTYSDLSVVADTTYFYRARAYEGPNHSDYSNVASATTQAAPTAPTGLGATAAGTSRINLTWTDNATNEAGFRVERSLDGASFAQIASLAANVTAYSDFAVAAATTYFYRVRAYEGANNSGYSNVASATTDAPPAAPTGLSATAVSTSRINLTWTDNATSEAGFKVERSTDGVSFVHVATTLANATSYSDFGLLASTAYFYRVRAYEGGSHSGYSNVASATTQQAPAAPSGLSAAAVSSTRIDLAWTDNATNEGGFKVERSTDGVSFTQIATIGANATAYADYTVSAARSYFYRVRAYEGPNHSGYSNVAAATTP